VLTDQVAGLRKAVQAITGYVEDGRLYWFFQNIPKENDDDREKRQ
jgi:hypothetical protein